MSKVEEIDQLIERHKAALKRIEDTKSFFFYRSSKPKAPKLPFMERVKAHFQIHSVTWSHVIYMGCILVLSLRLLALRREFAVR